MKKTEQNDGVFIPLSEWLFSVLFLFQSFSEEIKTRALLQFSTVGHHMQKVCQSSACQEIIPTEVLKYFYFSHTSGSHCEADRRQLTLLFLKPIQANIIRNVGKNTVILNNRYKLSKTLC